MFYWSDAFKKILASRPQLPAGPTCKNFFKRVGAISTRLKKFLRRPKAGWQVAGWHGTWVAWHRLWALLWALLGAIGPYGWWGGGMWWGIFKRHVKRTAVR